jgi:tRNA-uridine 2-sulfurtransferase
VGQRRGIGVSGPDALYVIDRDAAHGRVVVGERDDLKARTVALRGVRLRRAGARIDCVKLRYRSRPLPVRIPQALAPGYHNRVVLELEESASGPAPGQLACLMERDVILGWGTIARA